VAREDSQWKKGQSGNPKGRPPLSAWKKYARRLALRMLGGKPATNGKICPTWGREAKPIQSDLLLQLMRERKISQTALARVSSIRVSALNQIVRGIDKVGPKRMLMLEKGLTSLGFSADEIKQILNGGLVDPRA
jgi:hypothetical protein